MTPSRIYRHGSTVLVSDGELATAVERRLATWKAEGFAARLWAGESGLWGESHAAEARQRMGWLRLPESSRERLPAWRGWAETARREGVREVVLIGMGGSSLAAGLLATASVDASAPRLTVVDSTHPETVLRALECLRGPTWLLVATKSGTTLETIDLAELFTTRLEAEGERPQRFLFAITDSGSPLVSWLEGRAGRICLEAPADVGGRFSALSVFGLLPAVLAGVEADQQLAAATTMAEACGPAAATDENPALVLGAAIGEAARLGRDKLILDLPALWLPFGAWLEQLIAESLGKEGRGIVPVVGTPGGGGGAADRCVVHFAGPSASKREDEAPALLLPRPDPGRLAGELLRWELAVAAAATVLEVPPFNQPDVEQTKRRTRERLAGRTPAPEALAVDAAALDPRLATWLHGMEPPRYVAIQAFLAEDAAIDQRLDGLRRALEDRLGVVVTIGYGPRFLHSTGQLHKAGPASVACLQLVDSPPHEVPIPGRPYGCRTLLRAQADGDLLTLEERGRKVLRVDLEGDAEAGLARLADAVRSAGA